MKKLVMKKLFAASFLLMLCSVSFSQTTITLQPDSAAGKDASVHDLNISTSGTSPHLYASAWTWQNTPGVMRALIEFDLSSIPTGSNVLSAELSLWGKDNTPDQHSTLSGSNAWWIQKITSAWGENTVSWGGQPTTTTSNQVAMPQTSTPDQDFLNIDVIGIVQDMVDNPSTSHGFMIRLQNEAYYRALTFKSSDNTVASERPRLVVTYEDCQPPDVGFTSSATNLTVDFTDTTANSISWWWDFGDSQFSSSQNPQHIYSSAGTYTVCLIASDTCGTDTFCDVITIYDCPAPVAAFNYTGNGLTVDFTDQSNSAITWWWDFDDSQFSNQQNPQHNYSNAGTYNVCLIITDTCGTDTFCDSISVPFVGIYEAKQAARLLLYPNPTTGKFKVASLEPACQSGRFGVEEVEVYDVFGRLVPANFNIGRSVLDIRHCPAGIYLVKIGQHTEKLVLSK